MKSKVTEVIDAGAVPAIRAENEPKVEEEKK